MKCKEIHGKDYGCDENIPEKGGWYYCPHCGKYTGHVVLDSTEISVRQNISNNHNLTIRNKGLAPVQVKLRISDQLCEQNVELQRDVIDVQPLRTALIALRIPPINDSCNLAGIEFVSKDNFTTDYLANPWQKRSDREEVKILKATVKKKAEISLLQDIVFFRNDLSEREVSLKNIGDEKIGLPMVICPVGYSCVGDDSIIPGGDIRTFKITRNFADKQPAEISDLFFKFENGDRKVVKLHFPRQKGSVALHRAVVGVDFGTSYTSVTFRRCNHNPLVDDKVEFLHPDDNNKRRFRTRVWINKTTREMLYHDDATKKYDDNYHVGYLLREIKTLLRYDVITKQECKYNEIDCSNFLHPSLFASHILKFFYEQFGEKWPEYIVTHYIKWLYNSLIAPKIIKEFNTEDVRVKYVFSVPVLDYSLQKKEYNKYLKRLEQCILDAGFNGDTVEFQFEPACAALGLIHPLTNDWLRLGTERHPLQKGDTILVFDSGGGTSDVALAVVDIDDTGRTMLNINKCVGVGSKFETFGGELVTDMLISAIDNPFPKDDVYGLKEKIKSHNSDDLFRDVKINLGLKDIKDNEDEDKDANKDENYDDKLDVEVRDHVEENVKIPLSVATVDNLITGIMSIKKELLDSLIFPLLDSFGQEMNYIFTNYKPAEIKYYICVGGNSKLNGVEKWVTSYMHDSAANSRRKLSIPDGDRDIAVAYGAAWVPDSRVKNQIPYNVCVSFNTYDGSMSICEIMENTSQEINNKSEQIKMYRGESASLKVTTNFMGIKNIIAVNDVTNYLDSDAHLELVVNVQNGRLSVTKRLKSVIASDFDDIEDTIIEYKL